MTAATRSPRKRSPAPPRCVGCRDREDLEAIGRVFVCEACCRRALVALQLREDRKLRADARAA